ncbi:MAG: hypothetical protein JXA21_22710 [Anaerolineae bacterium]|nr:hypothetical protein [Anaerolineae bacterium]
MVSSRSLVFWGILIMVLGCLLLCFAFPVLTWVSVEVDEYGISFSFPNTWAMTQGEEILPNLDSLLDGQEDQQARVNSIEPESDALYYQAKLCDSTSSATMHISAYPLDNDNAKAEHYASAMQYMREQTNDNYLLFLIRDVEVDGYESYQSIDTFRQIYDDCNCNKQVILVASYTVANNHLYHFTLLEDNWLNFARDFKIYQRLVEKVNIQ